MTVKVIHSGVVGWRGQTTCTCDTKLEFEADDVSIGDFGCGWGDDHEYEPYVRCPECTARVRLKATSLPQWVRNQAKRQ